MNVSRVFKESNFGQGNLFPMNLDDLIPSPSPVRLVSNVVDGLDLSRLYKLYKGGGASSYHPKMMLKVIFYAYMNNIYSCRKIEDLMKENVHYMWLSGQQTPVFTTINRFRSQRIKTEIHNLFTQVVTLLVEVGQISLENMYVDGTKIESVANRYTFVWKKSVLKNKEKLEGKIRDILSQVEAGIAQDNCSREELPEAIDSMLLAAKIDELNRMNKAKKDKAQSESEPQSKEDKAADKQEDKMLKELSKKRDKLAEYEKQLETLGDRNSYSKTDNDATFLHAKAQDAVNNPQTLPLYNVQISTEEQYITNYDIGQKAGDTTTLQSFTEKFEERYGKYPESAIADAGYGSEENYQYLENHGIAAFVKYNTFHTEMQDKTKNNPFLASNLYYNKEKDFLVCPMGQRMSYIGSTTSISENGHTSILRNYRAINCSQCSMKGPCTKAEGERVVQVNVALKEYRRKARERLESEDGINHRSKRQIEPEAVFGQIKFNKAYNRFRHKGLEKVSMDFAIFAVGFNLQKLMAFILNGTNNHLCVLVFNLKRLWNRLIKGIIDLKNANKHFSQLFFRIARVA